MCWFEDPGFANDVCKLVYEKYKGLGKKGKPVEREWTILAAVVGVFNQDGQDCRMELISLGTGSKCLGKNQLSPSGNLVNDSHAEVIARRGFLRFLYDQLQLAYSSKESIFKVEEQSNNTCSLKDGVTFHLFASHTPCGDASIFPKYEDEKMPVENHSQRKRKFGHQNLELDLLSKIPRCKSLESVSCTNVKYDRELSGKDLGNTFYNSESFSGVTIQSTTDQNSIHNNCMSVNDSKVTQDVHRTGAKCVPDGNIQDSLDIGTGYHSTSALRTKPGRGDPTLSMSCSDKFMKWCIVGCQGALISLFLQKPIYFLSFVFGNCAYNEEAMKRAVFRRASNVITQLPDGYSLSQPRLLQADLEFDHSKRKVEEARRLENKDWKLAPSPSAIIWINKPSFYEISVNGVKQGVTKANRDSPKSRVCICKAELFSEFKKVISLVPKRAMLTSVFDDQKTYKQFKNEAQQYNTTKEKLHKVLGTWMKKPAHLEMFSKT